MVKKMTMQAIMDGFSPAASPAGCGSDKVGRDRNATKGATMTDDERGRHDIRMERRASEMAIAWHGWGSPVGLGLLLVAIGTTALLLSRAIWG
jgi:hypothetical protein